MCTRRALLTVALTMLAASYVRVFAQGAPGLGKTISESDVAAWDISILPDGTGLPPGSGTPEQGSTDLRGQVRRVPRRERKGRQRRGAHRRSAADVRDRDAEDGRELLAVRDDDFRFHTSCDAVAAAAHADQRRGLRADGVHPGAEQNHRRDRRHECADAAQGAHAESRRLIPASRNASPVPFGELLGDLGVAEDFTDPATLGGEHQRASCASARIWAAGEHHLIRVCQCEGHAARASYASQSDRPCNRPMPARLR